MTHKDIYTKFMIEYDKANVTSSYPSLTEYEVATVLDKAYNALIAQKVTGNNVRRVALEGDLKSVTDISPLIKTEHEQINKIVDLNVYKASLPEDYLYYITADLIRKNQHTKMLDTYTYRYIGEEYQGNVDLEITDVAEPSYEIGLIVTEIDNIGGIDVNKQDIPDGGIIRLLVEVDDVDFVGTKYYYFEKHILRIAKIDDVAIDDIKNRRIKVNLVSHLIANKFIASDSNIPWVKNPVCYIEDKNIYIVCDSWNTPTDDNVYITYIKTPNKFAKDLDKIEESARKNPAYDDCWDATIDELSYFNPTFKFDESELDTSDEDDIDILALINRINNLYTFECNDTVAEELISLAVAFALENVESQRLNSKLNMRGLEA